MPVTNAVGFVTLADGHATNGDALRQWCATNLAAYTVPSSIQIIDAMPTVAGVNGAKIKVTELRTLAQNLARPGELGRREEI